MRDFSREAWEVFKLGWGFVVGAALGVLAIVEAVEGSHNSGWFWGFWAMTALLLATGWRLFGSARDRSRLEAEIASDTSPQATARRLEALANEGDRLRDDMPGTDVDWHRAVVGEGLEGIMKHWAYQIESELRRNAPQYLARWKDANPPDIPLGQGWTTAAYARRMVEFSAMKAREMATELRNP